MYPGISREITDVFEKHVGLVERLGNGNFGLRAQLLEHNIRIEQHPTSPEILLIKNDNLANGWDCLRTAYRMSKDLHPAFAARIAYTYGPLGNEFSGPFHFFLEVDDNSNGKVIQLDASPWYGFIEPGHYINGRIFDIPPSSFAQVPLANSAAFIELEKTPYLRCIETFLGGYFPNLWALPNEGQSRQSPKYSLSLMTRSVTSFLYQPFRSVSIKADIIDIETLSAYIHEGMLTFHSDPIVGLESLISRGLLNVHIISYEESREVPLQIKSFNTQKNNIGLTDCLLVIALESEEFKDIVRNLTKNADVLMNVLAHLPPEIIVNRPPKKDLLTSLAELFSRTMVHDIAQRYHFF